MGLPKKQRTKNLIMHTAKGLFEKKGIDNVTFAEIAEAADVCRTTVFNHFKCTNDLLFEIFVQEMKDLELHCTSKKLYGLDFIKTFFHKLIGDIAPYPNLAIRLSNNAILSDMEPNPIVTVEEIIQKHLAEEGITDPVESDYLAALITGSYLGLVTHYKTRKHEFDAERMHKVFDIMLKHILGGYYHD
mgnify:CR=1 FL=1